MTTLVITETNWLMSAVLARDASCGYLLTLAEEGDIDIAIPEYSLHESDGKLLAELRKRENDIDTCISILNTLSRSEYYKKHVSNAKRHIKKIKDIVRGDERGMVKSSLENARSSVTLINFSPSVFTKAELRFESSKAPFKKSDCRIYESIIEFLREEGKEYDKFIFYTADRDDFDHEEIHQELRELNCELYFNSGEVVKRVRELIP